MTGAVEVGRILRSTPTSHDRILYFGALLARESGSDVTIADGSAIEIYTSDGMCPAASIFEPIGELFDELSLGGGSATRGSLDSGDWRIAVDVVGDRYTGDPYRAMTLLTPYGPVPIAVVEDLFVKRLAAAKHWQVRAALDEAELLWRGYSERMDAAYLDQQADTYKVTDLLAEFRTSRGGATDSRTRDG